MAAMADHAGNNEVKPATIRLMLQRDGYFLLMILLVLCAPFAYLEFKRAPWILLERQVLADAPGQGDLRMRDSGIAFAHAPGFNFNYETGAGAWPTQDQFLRTMEGLEFQRRALSWEYGELRAYFTSRKRQVACNIAWRPPESICKFHYPRDTCNPERNLVYGNCSEAVVRD